MTVGGAEWATVGGVAWVLPACHSERPRESVLTEATGPVLSSVEGSEESRAGRAGVVVGRKTRSLTLFGMTVGGGGMDDSWGARPWMTDWGCGGLIMLSAWSPRIVSRLPRN